MLPAKSSSGGAGEVIKYGAAHLIKSISHKYNEPFEETIADMLKVDRILYKGKEKD